MKYLSNLKLVPLKDSDKQTFPPKNGNGAFVDGLIEFDQSRKIFINEILIDKPTVLHISSSIHGFKGNGYYKIVDSKFDYNYIFDLMGNAKTVE